MKNLTVALIAFVALIAGILIAPQAATTANTLFDYQVSNEGFTIVRPYINGTTIYLSSDCYVISFDVTPDQAYSIEKGMEGSLGPRPLTHDIMKDILDNYKINITNIRIDRYDNEIYYATIYMRQENKILELDARPSDSIALSIRTGIPIYFRDSILMDRGVYICR
jgi:bifunctional DNase/RNase